MEDMTREQAIAYLTRGENLAVFGRWGPDTKRAAQVAYDYATIIAENTGEHINTDMLSELMALVVNDHSDVVETLREWGNDRMQEEYEGELYEHY